MSVGCELLIGQIYWANEEINSQAWYSEHMTLLVSFEQNTDVINDMFLTDRLKFWDFCLEWSRIVLNIFESILT